MDILTPFDLPQNQEVLAALDKSAKERQAREAFVDRREGATLKMTVRNSEARLGQLNADVQASKNGVESAQDTFDATQKLLKKVEAMAAKMPQPVSPMATIMSDIAALQKKLDKATGLLHDAQHRADQAARRLAEHKKGMAEFLAYSPRKGLKTNAELIKEYTETERLSASLRTF